jgi:hypothetical protein
MGRTADRIEEELEFIGTIAALVLAGMMTYRSDLGRWRMKDAIGEFDPRDGGSGVLVKVSANDTTAAFLEEKIVSDSTILLDVVDEGGNETLRVRVAPTANAARLPAPTEPSNPATGVWSEVGAAVYPHALFGSATSRKWVGYITFANANTMNIRVVRETDGAVVGPSVNFSADGLAEVPITDNLPTADDALVLQIQRVGTQQGGRVVAGFFEFAGL